MYNPKKHVFLTQSWDEYSHYNTKVKFSAIYN